MSHTTIELQTQDGRCPAHVFHPEGEGPWPGVIFHMDGIGIRAALFYMAERMASAGYYVLLPNLYYRVGSPSYDARTLFTDPVTREDFNTRTRPSASIENIMRDSETFLAYLEARPQVRKGKVGVTRYCMGGSLGGSLGGS